MTKTLTMRLDEGTYQAFVRAAKAERRSLANLVQNAALQHLLETSFVDDAEMAEIASRPELLKRLQAGSRHARKRQGRFVPPLWNLEGSRHFLLSRQSRNVLFLAK
jgi:uncharacterized protein (DUF1778 family)